MQSHVPPPTSFKIQTNSTPVFILSHINNKNHKAMKMISCSFSSYKAFILLLICVILGRSSCSAGDFDEVVVKREERRTLVSTEYGQISAARVVDHTINGSYLLHFFTLDPNSLFLPVILHADMVLYVHTGSGKLRWREEDEVKSADLRRGDVHRLEEGSIFLIQSNLDTESERQKLRIHAIFATPDQYIHEIGPYSSIRDMLLGFDEKVLQAAFKVPPEKIQELVNGTKSPAIIHGLSEAKNTLLEMEARLVEILVGSTTSNNIFEINKKKKKKKKKDKDKTKLFNLLNADKDFENCNGWSTAVTMKKIPALRGTNIGLFMVNLTEGSMMGPHWNPRATEIAVVVQGRGMIRVVCPGNSNETGCRNMLYEVEEGDTFVVPRFHAMAQMAFNNDTFVFMGFSTSAGRNHPQYLAGQASVLRTLDKDVLAVAFNVTNTTMDQLLNSQKDSVILSCISCAEEEFKYVEEEMEKERAKEREREAEEARKREEERQREEEEAARQEEERERREEEEERKSQEEEARKREEEAAKRQEEERKRQEEEEEARRAEEEERKRQEEEARKREEEAARKQEEERKKQEEEEARRREDEERKRQEEEEEEEVARRREEEEEAARRQEDERKRQEEEDREREEAARREEKEEAEEEERKTEEDEERKRREEEAAAATREEEEEEARKREEEVARREDEERKRREQEEEEEAAARRREEEEAAERARHEQEGGRSEEEQAQAQEEERRRQEEAQREEEERGPPTKMKKSKIHLLPTRGWRFPHLMRRD